MFLQTEQSVCLLLQVWGTSPAVSCACGVGGGPSPSQGMRVADEGWQGCTWPLRHSVCLQELGVSFGECSAALGHNILEPMMNLAR